MRDSLSSRSAMQWMSGATATAISTLLLFLTFNHPTEAEAAERSDRRQIVRIDYSDLNLAHPAGREVLNRRIQAAARQVCGNQYEGSLQVAEARANCIREAVTKAQREIPYGRTGR